MANDLNRSVKIYIDNSAAMTSAAELEKQIGELTGKLQGLKAAGYGNTAQSKRLEREIASQTGKFGKYKKEVAETERVLRNLSGATYNELILAKRRVDAELKKTTRGTELYNQRLIAQKAISREVAIAQREMRTELGCQATFLGKAAAGINKYFGMIGGGVYMLSKLTGAFDDFTEKLNKLEESKADVKALTGLDDESVEWLTAEARKLSESMTKEGVRITQSATEILQAYKLVGSAKPELLGNKEALAEVTRQTMILSKASGMDLTKAVDGVTLSMNQYGASADEASRYVNVLAAGSKYGAVAVESQTAAIRKAGVSAAQAGIPIEQLVGTIETLGEKGIKDEVAGTGLKKFFLTLQTGADDTNPKVVGLAAALENLRKKQLDATAVKKMFDEEGYNVASVLIDEAEKVDHYTKAVTGTSVAVEQAAIMSDTATSKLEQNKNKLNDLGIELVERVNPAFVASKLRMAELAMWVVKNSGLIATLGVTLAAYTLVVKSASIATRLMTYWQKAHNKESVKTVTIDHAVKVGKIALAGAQALLTGNLIRARAAWVLLNRVMVVNPIVAIGVAIAALTVGIYKLVTRTTEADRAMRSFMESSIKEQTELDKLYRALKRSGEGTALRTKLLGEFNTKYGEYLPNLLTEKSTLGDIETAYKNVTKAMRENLAQKTLDEKIGDVESESLSIKAFQLDEIRDKMSGLHESVIPDALGAIVKLTDKGVEAGIDMDTAWKAILTRIRNDFYNGDTKSLPWARDLENYMKQVYKTAGKIDKLRDRFNPFLPKEEKKKEKKEDSGGHVLPEIVVTPNSEPAVSGSGAKTDKDINDAKLRELDRYIAEKRLKISADYADGLLMSDDYNRKLEALELEKLNRQLEVYNVGSDERKKIEQLILDYKIKLLDKGYQAYMDNMDKESAADAKRKNDKKKLFDKENDDLQSYVDDMEEIQQASLEAQKEKAEQRAQMILDFSAQAGMILGESLTDSETSFAEAMGNILLLTLDSLRQVVTMSIAESTIKSVGSKGPIIGLVEAAAKIALINAAFGAVKGLIKKPTVAGAKGEADNTPKTGKRVATGGGGYALGGYTGDGGTLEVAGLVHKREYVVPAWEMSEPAAMNHVLALEAIRTRRADTYAPGAGYASGGYAGKADTPDEKRPADIALAKAIDRLIAILGTLTHDKIKAYVVYSELQKAKDTLDKSKKIGSK